MALVMMTPAQNFAACSPEELRRMRTQARTLLGDLLLTRADCEERLDEAGTRDPLKSMTGSSALDTAVLATRQIIRRLEELDRPVNGAVVVEPKCMPAGVQLTR
jgi:hypothetical protein